MLLVPLLATLILQYRQSTVVSRIVMFCLLFAATCAYLSFLNRPATFCTKLACNKGEVILVHHNKQTMLIDPGYIAQSAQATSWFEHTLLKEMTKHIGSTTIHHLVLLQPSSRIFKAVTKLCSLTRVENIYLPTWEGSTAHNQWNNFFEMRAALEQTHSGSLIRVTTTMMIALDQREYLTITPTERVIKTSSMRYPALHVSGLIGGKKIMTASAKSFTKQK